MTRNSWWPLRPTTRRTSWTSSSACAPLRPAPTRGGTPPRSRASPAPWSARWGRWTAPRQQVQALERDFEEIRDITVIGAGPVGMCTAFWAGMREASSRVIDSLPELGGQLTTLYPEKWIFDVPGHPKVLARDLVEMLRQ